MRQIGLVVLVILSVASGSHAGDGLTTIKSAHGVDETADRLESLLQKKGMTVFARVNHSAAAQKVGKTLRPTQLLIFGNPKVGTPLMQCDQAAGIDLPQKALIWEDADGKVWLAYNDPNYLAARHGLNKACGEAVRTIEKALGNFAKAATAP